VALVVRKPFADPWLFWACLGASLAGLVAIWDAGYARTQGSVFPGELKNQAVYLVLALLAGWGCSRIPRKSWKWLGWVGLGLSVLALVAVQVIGVSIGGAQRWIGIGRFTIQPSEFIKLAAVMFLAATMAAHTPWQPPRKAFKNFGEKLDRVILPKFKRALPFLLVCGLAVAVERQPDLATGAMIVACGLGIIIVAGVSRKSLLWLGVAGVVLVGIAVVDEPYRLERFRVHAERWEAENRMDGGYQTIVSETALARGGVFGVGIGNGIAKHRLPAPTTDFVLATVGEEFGLIGVLVFVGVLGTVTWRFFWLALRAPDAFGRLALVGMGTWVGVQTCTSVMMVNGALPPIGIPLPFVSYGGSSLLALWMGVGLSMSMAPQQTQKKEVETPATGSYGWRDRRPRVPSA
jgi:cell division protein FtsW